MIIFLVSISLKGEALGLAAREVAAECFSFAGCGEDPYSCICNRARSRVCFFGFSVCGYRYVTLINAVHVD